MKLTNLRTNVGDTILVTGGAGYIGGCLVRQLLESGHLVRVLDSLLYGPGALYALIDHPLLDFNVGDIRDRASVQSALAGVDAVVHLAAIVGDPACALDPARTENVNWAATQLIADEAIFAGICRFVFASTCSVYGASSSDLTEDSEVNPVSLYAETKIASEHLLLERTSDRFQPTILRFATLCGLAPRLRFDLVANLLVGRAVRGRRIEIFGGEQWRPFLHVEDAASAIEHALGIPDGAVSGAFNVGSSAENYQLAELGKMVANLVPGTELLVDDASPDNRTYHVRFDRFAATGFVRSRLLAPGLTELRDYLQAHPDIDIDDPAWLNVRYLSANRPD